jgi:beta-fructofuranosidase
MLSQPTLPTPIPEPNDPLRPTYHFLPPSGWMNDPNGLVWSENAYHLFYQCNPRSAAWGEICWGHAVSRDLVRWEHRPVALQPSPGGVDAVGCWSGYAVMDGEQPTLLYTGVSRFNPLTHESDACICLARGDPAMNAWHKHARNPLVRPPTDLDLIGFRDPFLWRDGQLWQMIVGAGIRGQGGAVLRYESPDLEHWTYRGPLLVGDAETARGWTDTVWECPQLVTFAGQQALIVSTWADRVGHEPMVMLGKYDDGHFGVEDSQRLDGGDSLYAAQVVRDASNRWILLGWLREARDETQQLEAGWSGVMSLPRVLTLGATGRLEQWPLPELEHLRGARFRLTNVSLTAGSLALEPRGATLEIRALLRPVGQSAGGVAVRCSRDGGERTNVVYDWQTGQLSVDRRASSLGASNASTRLSMHVSPRADASVELRIFLDGSTLEVFCHGSCLSSRIYPVAHDSLGIELLVLSGVVDFESVELWHFGEPTGRR